MKKKILCLLLAMMMTVGLLAACGGDSSSGGAASTGGDASTGDDPSTGTGASVQKVAVVLGLGGLGDKSFNDNAMEGLENAKSGLGIEFQYVEPNEIAEFEGHHRDFAKSGEYALIIGIGFDQADAISAVATEFPDQKFVLIDGEAAASDNVASITFKDNEKCYLVGVIAGQMTEANKIGIVGGMDIPLINAFAAGYKAGALSVNPDVTVDVKYVGAWDDANTGKELAMSMYDSGCDIVMAAAGGSGLGVFSAAEDSGKLAIGADVNQIPLNPAHIFLSAVRRVDNAVYNEIEKVLNGTFEAGTFAFGLAEDVVTYTVEGAEVETPQEVLNAAEQARQDIVDGKTIVPTTLD